MVAAGLTSPFVGRSRVGFTVTPNADDLRHLAGLVETGKLTPVVDRTYPLAAVPRALRHLEAGRARGKVVITHAA
jgi:NADPH:quinone reductase-like Zn-dependent oxidoreductase